MSETQLGVLQQGNNFLNSKGAIQISELEIMITLQKERKKFIKQVKGTGNVCVLFSYLK
jgi:hypothetical protein